MTHRHTKVLMFGWELPPFNSGGLGVACEGLSKALSKDGVDITFVLPRTIPLKIDYMHLIFASDIVDFPKSVSRNLAYTFPALYKKIKNKNNPKFFSLMDEVSCFASAAEIIARDEDFDLIHAHDWLSFPAAIKAKEISGKPLITHIHATELDRTAGEGNRDIYRIEKNGMEYGDSVVAVSNLTKNIIIDNYQIPPSKVKVIHNGVDMPREEIRDEILELKKHNKIVLFVGRLTVQKGPDYFLKAAKKILERQQDVIFVIVGDGDMKRQLIKDSISLGISGNTIFAGFLRDNVLKSLYRMADIFVMPSVSEPFGIAGLESAINGTPVLVSRQSGVSEVLHHALQVDFWDIDEMANKILAVIGYAALKKTLQENVRSEAGKQTWDKSAEKVRDVYRSLLASSEC